MDIDQQIKFIKDNYLTIPIKTLASKIGRSQTFVRNQMIKLNLTVPLDIIEQRKKDSQFAKGNVSHNKGLKQSDFMSPEAIERTKATTFKKGNEPHNTKKEGDGAISIRKDKSGHSYKYIRIKKGVWELYHRVVWEQKNGEIPDNHVVIFKDGDSMNVAINNLELITMKENMIRNSVQRFPPEIRKNIQLIGAINRQINKRNGKKQ